MANQKFEVGNFLGQVHKWAVYLITFLLPLFFLPFTSLVIELNKQTLLLILTALGILAWLLKSIIEGKLAFLFHWIYIPFALFLLAVLASAIFSFYPYASLWGYPLKTASAFFSWLGLGFYFLLIVLFLNGDKDRQQKETQNLFLTLIISGVIAAALGLVQLYQQFFLPWDFAKSTSFNTIGTLNSWAVFLGTLIPLSALMMLFVKGAWWWFYLFALIIFLFSLLAANFWVAWVVSLTGLVVIIAFGLLFFQEQRVKVILPLVLFVIAVLFGIFRVSWVVAPSANLEVLPTFSHTLDIALKTVQERPLTGSGPGTFSYDYAKFRSETVNPTLFWNIRFANGASELIEWLATLGLLGVAVFLILASSLTYLALSGLLKESPKNNEQSFLLLMASLSLFVAVFFGFALYSVSLPLEMLWALSGALILALAGTRIAKTWDFNLNKLAGVAAFLIFTVAVIGILGMISEQNKRYTAELNYVSGLRLAAADKVELALGKITKAAQLNPSADIYWRDLSQLALNQLALAVRESAAFNQGNGDLPQEIQDRIQRFFNLAVASANQAVQVSSYNALNWFNLGQVYRSMIGLAQGAFEQSIEAYRKAQELEPKNPDASLQIAITNIVQAQLYLQRQVQEEKAKELLSQTREELDKAIALKNNFWPAYFQQAVVLDLEGNLDQAITKLEEIKPFNQQDAGLAFQLGGYYFRQENFDKSKRELERAVKITPNFANAYYFLGLIYDRQGDKAKAIEQFEKIASFSEDNAKQVQPILNNLRVGRPALGEQRAVQEVPQLEEKQ